MKKIFIVALLSIGIIFTGLSLYAGPDVKKAVTAPQLMKEKWNPSATKMKVLIDVASGDILVYEVKGGKETLVKPGSIKEMQLNGKQIVSIPDYTVIRTKSSPECTTIFYYGWPYQVCN